MDSKQMMNSVTNILIGIGGVYAGQTASKMVTQKVLSTQSEGIKKAAPLAIVAGAQYAKMQSTNKQLHVFLDGVSIGAGIELMNGYGVTAKLNTALSLTGAVSGGLGEPEILFEDNDYLTQNELEMQGFGEGYHAPTTTEELALGNAAYSLLD